MSDTDLQNRMLAARLAMAKQSLAPTSGPPPAEVVAGDGTRMVLDPATGSYTSAELMAGNMKPSVGGALVSGAANGATLGWGDELAGVLGSSPLAVERGRATMAAGMRDHPVASILGNVGGGGAMIAPAVAALPEVATSMGGKMMLGAGTGAALGGLQGAGDANDGNRLRGGVIGGAMGTVMGIAAPVVQAGISAGARKVIDALRGTDLTGIKSALGVSNNAAKILKTTLGSDDPAASAAAMQRAGPNAMIADSSPQASQMLDTTVAAGGPAMSVARDAVEGRASAAKGNLEGVLDGLLGAPQGMKEATGSIASRTAAARKSAYDTAYSKPIDYSAPEGQAIEGVLARVDDDTLNAAIKKANNAMKEAGTQNMQIKATIAPDGSVSFSQPLNVQQLDYIKKGLDAIKRDGTDGQTGKVTDDAGRAGRLARDLRGALGSAVPDYDTAVKLGGDKIAEEEALKMGAKLLLPTTTREDVANAMCGAWAEQVIAAKQGIRRALDEAMSNVKAKASDPNLDASEAMKAVKDFSSEAVRTKATAVLGQTEADKLFEAFDQAASQLALKTAIARNSATAARMAGKDAMDGIVNGGVVNAARHGEGIGAVKRIVQALTGATPEGDLAKAQAVYGEVARALTQKRGSDAAAALATVQKAIAGSPASEAQAKAIASLLTKGLAGGGYHTGMQIRSRSGGAQ